MRTITKIIIHCSATPEGRHITIDDIDKWHKQQGFSCIGYHYVIYLDGSIHKGRPVAQVGAHCLGHNGNSIGICYIGGTDIHGKPKDTRTQEQKQALQQLVTILTNIFPNVTIHGHNEFSNKSCPCFVVSQEF